MFETVGQIKKAIARRESDLSELRSRMDSDFDLWALTEYKAKSAAYESWTSSSPKNFFNKVVDGLNRASLTVSIRLPEEASDEERDAASTGELYLFGALAAIDRTLRMKGEPPLRQGSSFLMGARGWVALRALVYVPEGEEDTVFDVVPWDMRHVTWEQGSRGLIWAAHKRKVSNSQIEDEYGIDLGRAGETWVIDFYDRDKNCVIVRDVFAKDPAQHKIGHVPVWIGAVGGMPTMQPGSDASGSSSGAMSGSLLKYRGQSVWDASRALYEPVNKHISTLMDIAKKGSVGSLVHKSKKGKAKIVGDPHETFRVIPLAEDESLVPLESPRAPPETFPVLRVLTDDLDQASLPNPLSFGGTNAPESGRALAIRIDATRSVFNPFTSLLAEEYTWLIEELLGQFANKGMKPADLRGFRPARPDEIKVSDEVFFQVKVKPEDINPAWFVNATVEPRLPRDEENEIIMAIQATSKKPGEQPLMSKRTAREIIIKMRDPDAEEARILIEEGKSLAPIQARRIAAELTKAGEEALAEEVLALIPQPGQTGPAGVQNAPVPKELIEDIVRTLIEANQPELAQDLISALDGGEGQQGPAQVQAQPVEGQEQTEPKGLPADVITLIREIAQVLAEAGRRDLAVQFVEALQSGQAPSPEVVEEVVNVLIDADRSDLAKELLNLLGVPQQGVGEAEAVLPGQEDPNRIPPKIPQGVAP